MLLFLFRWTRDLSNAVFSRGRHTREKRPFPRGTFAQTKRGDAKKKKKNPQRHKNKPARERPATKTTRKNTILPRRTVVSGVNSLAARTHQRRRRSRCSRYHARTPFAPSTARARRARYRPGQLRWRVGLEGWAAGTGTGRWRVGGTPPFGRPARSPVGRSPETPIVLAGRSLLAAAARPESHRPRRRGVTRDEPPSS